MCGVNFSRAWALADVMSGTLGSFFFLCLLRGLFERRSIDGGRCPEIERPSSSADSKCRVSIGETSSRGGEMAAFAVALGSGLPRGGTTALLGRYNVGVRRLLASVTGAASRRLEISAGVGSSQSRNRREFQRARGPWVAVLGRPGGAGTGGRSAVGSVPI